MLKDYLKGIFEVAKQGDAREESYYSTLADLVKAFAEATGKTKSHVTTLPKKTEAGNPDFRVWDGKQHIVGYVEAKPPTQENLEVIETSDIRPRRKNSPSGPTTKRRTENATAFSGGRSLLPPPASSSAIPAVWSPRDWKRSYAACGEEFRATGCFRHARLIFF